METSINVQTNTFAQRWKISGFADPRNNKVDIQIFNKDTGAIKVPYFDERYNLKSSFDSIRLNIENIDKSGGKLHIDGTSITNFRINHPKIASKDVVIKMPDLTIDLLGSDFISVDSSSTVQFNQVKLHPYISYDRKRHHLQTKIVIPKMKAQDFITSLPDGLFTHFQGMQTEGTFDYKLDFKFNKTNPTNSF
jgi:hypothetical protein